MSPCTALRLLAKACVGVLVCLVIGGVSVEAAASTLKVGACENYWPLVGEDSRGMWGERLGWENSIWVRPFWGFLDPFSSFNGSLGISNSGGYSSGFLFFWRDLWVILDLCIFLPFEKFSF